MISKCNSPIPDNTVWPVSVSVLTLNVGSSSTSFWIAIAILSWSFLDLASIAISITGSGNSMPFILANAFSSHNVSAVVVFFKPTAAAISPE